MLPVGREIKTEIPVKRWHEPHTRTGGYSMATDEKYVWNLPPVSRSSSLAAAELLQEMTYILVETLKERGWSATQISSEIEGVDDVIRTITDGWSDGELVSLQVVSMFFVDIKGALETGLANRAETKGVIPRMLDDPREKIGKVESLTAQRIDDSLAAMALLRERYTAVFESLQRKGWTEAHLIEEGKRVSGTLRMALSRFGAAAVQLGLTKRFLQEASLRASQFPSDSRNDYGALYLPPSDEAKTILSSMTEEEKLNFNDLLGRLQAWHESIAGTGASLRQGMRGFLLRPEIRACLWGTALAKIADHYREIGRLDRALFFSEAAWNLSRYPIFAYNAALLSQDIGDILRARTLFLTYLAEYRNALANPLLALVNPEVTPDELEQVARSARAKLATILARS